MEQILSFLTIFPCCGYPRTLDPWIEVLRDESDSFLLIVVVVIYFIIK